MTWRSGVARFRSRMVTYIGFQALMAGCLSCGTEPRVLVRVSGLPANAAWIETSIKLDGRATYQLGRQSLDSFAGHDSVTFGLRLPPGYGGHVVAVLTAGAEASGCVISGGSGDADVIGNYSDLGVTLASLPSAACNPSQPILVGMTPPKTRTTGGATAILRGLRFQPGASVYFDDVRSDSVEVRSELELAATIPAKPGALGLVPVRITNVDKATTSRADLFSYYAGSTQFTKITTNPISEPYSIISLSLGKVDKNYGTDLVVTTNGNVFYYVGDNSGFLNARVDTGIITGAEAAQVADLNQDSFADIVFPGQGKVFLNRPAMPGTFQPGPGATFGSFQRNGVVADLNGDGLLDTIATDIDPSSPACQTTLQNFIPNTSARGPLCIYTGLNRLNQVPPKFENMGGLQYTFRDILTTDLTTQLRSHYCSYTKTGHINRDSALDIVTLGTYDYNTAIGGRNSVILPWVSSVRIFLNSGNGTFASSNSDLYDAPNKISTNQPSDSVLVIDLNGDNKDEILIIDQINQKILIMDNDGNGKFTLRTTAVDLRFSTPNIIRSADVDGDGTLDLIVGFGDNSTVGKVQIYLNEGDGKFLDFRMYDIPVESGVTTMLVAPVFGSSRPDLLIGQASGKILLYKNTSL